MSQALSGPICTRILADLGADVIKIEPPITGEASRRMGTSFKGGESYYYMHLNRNKRGITLNLRTKEGLSIFKDLVMISDVVLDNFRPGVTTRLGIRYEQLKTINPTIICCSVSGFGQTGPNSDTPVFDSVIQAASGAMSVTGEPKGLPNVMGFAVTDIGGGYGATVGVLAALLNRERTGEGREVDISLLDVQLTFQGHLSEMYLGRGVVPTPGGSVQSANLPNGAFLAKDGKYLQIHCATQKFYDILSKRLSETVDGLHGLAEDDRFIAMDGRRQNWEELEKLLAYAFSTKTSQEWMAILGHEVPIAPINNLAEALEQPQAKHRNMVVEADHPVVGKYSMTGNPIKMGQEEFFEPAPTLGQHNCHILQELLGYPSEHIESLQTMGII